MKVDLRKIYRFEPLDRAVDGSLPMGGHVYYECSICQTIVPSVLHIKSSCVCGNISGGGGKTEIKEPAKVTPLKGILK